MPAIALPFGMRSMSIMQTILDEHLSAAEEENLPTASHGAGRAFQMELRS